jgi:hypothetical protein
MPFDKDYIEITIPASGLDGNDCGQQVAHSS